MSATTLLLVHPARRSGNQALDPVRSVLAGLGPVDFHTPASPERLAELICERGPKAARIVIGGGDGTINAALLALLDCDRPLGILPLGQAGPDGVRSESGIRRRHCRTGLNAMPPVVSDDQARLLDACSDCRALRQRYAHALEHLIEQDSAHRHIEARLAELDRLAERLEQAIRERNLLPRQADPDLEDLRELGDTVRHWLGAEATCQLLAAFAEEERELAEQLAALPGERFGHAAADARGSCRRLQQLADG